MSDAVLVIGGGIAGLRSALDLAHAGARAIVLESRATIGGKLASLLEEGGGGLDLPEAHWIAALEAALPERLHAVNLAAFRLGRETVLPRS